MTRSIPVFSERNLIELRNRTPLLLQFAPDGGILAQRHGQLLLNQIVPDPLAQGLFRLMVRERSGNSILGWTPVAGAGIDFAVDGGKRLLWRRTALDGLDMTARVEIHPDEPAWMWTVTVKNTSSSPRCVDVLFAQDLGLGDEGAVRNNEAYNSHYLDLHPMADPELGWVILARQNQPTSEGAHPVLAAACLDGACAYATDGRQFFGPGHRLYGAPLACSLAELPSSHLQYECAMACLQSRAATLNPGESVATRFVLRFVPDHPEATGNADIGLLSALSEWRSDAADAIHLGTPSAPSLFIDTPVIAGQEPDVRDWSVWFPGESRHVERTDDGRILSFFCGEATHVVSRAKEATVWRPHGHVLRGGEALGPAPSHFGLTCYASGIFAVQAYFGNSSLNRLLPVVRDQLCVLRATGQRIFVRNGATWAQLGVPSAFSMTPTSVRWIYRLEGSVVECVASCVARQQASVLEVNVLEGVACEFLVTHRICLGSTEDTVPAHVDFLPEKGLALIEPESDGVSYAIGMDSAALSKLGGDELVQADAPARKTSYVVFATRPVSRFRLMMAGAEGGAESARVQLESARAALSGGCEPHPQPAQELRLLSDADAAAGRISDILPWFNHDAWIHFSAPHGLEQSGGGAWGVRDVCQGSMEWLLATGRVGAARGVLCEVFRQQYLQDGDWPQWFMLPPDDRIRQMDSHGDILFWPLKALCLYLERSNDFSILSEGVPYMDMATLNPTPVTESILEHCDRILARIKDRLLPGTALIDYGNGDWDDTLQPADPSLKNRMVSAWTVGLACQTLGLFADVCRRAGETVRADTLATLVAKMRADFLHFLMVDDVVAGFLIRGDSGDTLLLHPRDEATGIHYRLIPMTRAILAGIFTPQQMRSHMDIIGKHLLFPDGVRLMSTPVAYKGGRQQFFRRAETAANVGREIGLMYVHAHLRYAEALAYIGDGEGLWKALQLVNPVGLAEVLPMAQARQANVFFSSSDADFADRREAERRWEELRAGRVPVRGGWRLYSSGPGLFLNLVRSSLLGLRESFGNVVFDPVLPLSLDGLSVVTELMGCPVTLRYSVKGGSLRRILVNGAPLDGLLRESNPYREGGLSLQSDSLRSLLSATGNTITLEL